MVDTSWETSMNVTSLVSLRVECSSPAEELEGAEVGAEKGAEDGTEKGAEDGTENGASGAGWEI